MLDPLIIVMAVILIVAIGLAALWHQRKRRSDSPKPIDHLGDQHFAQIACQKANDGLCIMDMSGIVQWVNPAYCRMMGRDASEMIGRNPRSYALRPEARPSDEELADFRLDEVVTGNETLELVENMRKDGTVFWNQINTGFHTAPGGQRFGIVVSRDVTALIEKEQQLEATTRELKHIAAHDELTGLANRTQLSAFLESALENARQRQTAVGVLHVDLDEFKAINDTYGHAAGDTVLRVVAQRLQHRTRDGDLVARIGGDEFVVVCCELSNLKELTKIADAIRIAVDQPITWDNAVLHCKVSIGAALSDDDSQTAADLLVQSDFALYEAKGAGRGRVAAYDAKLHRRQTRAKNRQDALVQAIRDKALTFYFQPVVARDPGVVRGFETLVRWEHPTDGMIAPDELLPLAQSLGVMADLDFLAMNAALDMKCQLNLSGHANVITSFNASPELLAQPDFCQRLLSGLAFRDLTPDDVIVEVLETVVFENHLIATPFVQTVADLDANGIFTVLDDFGSGNAGIAQLAKLAIRGVKFDKSIGMRILTDPTMEIVYRTLTGLCNELDLRMVTEGVETAAQAERLQALGCTNMQGFLIAKPLPADAVVAWLDAYTSSAIAPTDAQGYLKAK
ncbi:MAG: EAL domain-containing protein [Pseudomonadota bacterium]